MRLGVHCMVTNPEEYKFAWREAIQNYLSFADEVVVVDGESTDGTANELAVWAKEEPKLTVLTMPWPKEDYHYSEFARHINYGKRALKTDWVLKMDIDWLIHQDDFVKLDQAMHICGNNFDLILMTKFNVLNRRFGYEKVNVPFLVRASANLAYGRPTDREHADWAYPIHPEAVDDNGVPFGKRVEAPECLPTAIKLWNYDFFWRTKDEAKAYFWRYVKAWNAVHNFKFGDNPTQAFNELLNIYEGRLQKTIKRQMEWSEHPEEIRERVTNIKPEQFGHSNWGIEHTL